MTVNAYLNNVASACIIRDQTKAQIDASVRYIQNSIGAYFGADVLEQFVFGSYSRGTLLGPSLDDDADVDLMIVFSDNSATPQTYLNRLRRFVEDRYPRSEIRQSNPTIQLILNHITFELVPALKNVWSSDYKIPAPAAGFFSWMDTDPRDFNESLLRANQNNANLTKPLIRALKRWNAQHGHPFASYDLEKQIVANSPAGVFFTMSRLDEYFFKIVPSLSLPWNEAQWRRERLQTLQRTVQTAQSSLPFYETTAVQQLGRILSVA